MKTDPLLDMVESASAALRHWRAGEAAFALIEARNSGIAAARAHAENSDAIEPPEEIIAEAALLERFAEGVGMGLGAMARQSVAVSPDLGGYRPRAGGNRVARALGGDGE